MDAIQALGAVRIDVQRTPIDALAADGHKWMLGPEGAGFGYVRRDWVERLHPIGVGANSVARPYEFTTIDFTLKPHAGRWEGGAYNVPGIAAFGASLELLVGAGSENLERRVLELTDYLCDRATSAGLEVYSSRVCGREVRHRVAHEARRAVRRRDGPVPGGRGDREQPGRAGPGQPARLQHHGRN